MVLEGRKVKVFYEDGEKVSRKDGVVTSDDEQQIILSNEIVIPRQRIVRIEIEGGQDGQ